MMMMMCASKKCVCVCDGCRIFACDTSALGGGSWIHFTDLGEGVELLKGSGCVFAMDAVVLDSQDMLLICRLRCIISYSIDDGSSCSVVPAEICDWIVLDIAVAEVRGLVCFACEIRGCADGSRYAKTCMEGI